MISPTLSEWLNLILRWIHVFAGIMWVGTTYYFTWLDARLSEEEKAVANTGETAQIWMVHSGGFYVVEKRKVPDLASRTLHWFRWEAGTTWLSGFALLIVVYYIGGGALVDKDVSDISVGAAIGIGIGVIDFRLDCLRFDDALAVKEERESLCRNRLPDDCRSDLGLNAGIQRTRGLHSRRCIVWDDHGGKRLDANTACAEKNDCRAQCRAETGRCVERSGKTALKTKHVHGRPGRLHHDQQPFPRRGLRRSIQLGGARGFNFGWLGRREIYSQSVVEVGRTLLSGLRLDGFHGVDLPSQANGTGRNARLISSRHLASGKTGSISTGTFVKRSSAPCIGGRINENLSSIAFALS